MYENKSEIYSLTEATNLLLETYKWQTPEINEIKRYNSHKVRHTFWVLEVWRNILTIIKENIKLEDKLINKAEICFILHDIWRFFQNDWKKTLSSIEFDHWYKSYEIVKKNNYPRDIYLSIKYHSAYSIDWLYNEQDFISMSEKEKEDTIFLTQLLKDADKVQNILFSIFEYKDIDKNYFDKTLDIFSNWDISPINIPNIKNWKLLEIENIKTIWDYILLELCFTHEIFFKESYKILNFYNYFDVMFEKIKKTPYISQESFLMVKDVFEKYKSY